MKQGDDNETADVREGPWMDLGRDAHAGGYWRAALYEGVSLAVRSSDGRLVARVPLTRRVARFGATGLLKTTFNSNVPAGDLIFRLEAEGRDAFGERRIVRLNR